MAVDLRPLTLAELLDRTFSLYRKHLVLFVGIMAVPSIIGLVWALGLEALRVTSARAVVPGQPMTPAATWSYILPLLIGGFGLFAIYMVVYVIALGATTAAVSEVYLGREATIGSAYRRVRSRVGKLSLLMVWLMLRVGSVSGGLLVLSFVAVAGVGRLSPVVGGLLMGILILLAFLAMLIMSLRYSVAVPVATLEATTANSSVSRSVHLTRGHLGRVFLLFACGVIVTYATAGILQVPFMIGVAVAGPATTQAAVIRIAGVVLGTIGNTFVSPIPIIGLALMYYDFRIRKEGLDLDLMLDDLGERTTTAAAMQG